METVRNHPHTGRDKTVVVLYRSGKLEGSVADSAAPAVAVLFDRIAESLGLPALRTTSVFFNVCRSDAMHWSGQRIYDGLDATIYSVEIPAQPVYAYSVSIYNQFKKFHDSYTEASRQNDLTAIAPCLEAMTETVKKYHTTRTPINGNIPDFTARHEVLIHKDAAVQIAEWRTEYEPVLV